MIIYANGCSHTIGHDINWQRTWPHFIIRALNNGDKYQINPPKNEKKDKFVLYNEGIQGAGNDYIFHQSLESISQLLENKDKIDYAFIQWSGPNRRQHCLPDGEILNVNLFNNVEYFVKFEPLGSMHTLHYIYATQEFLKKNNIEYCFLNFMQIDESIKKLSIYKEIDFEKFLYIKEDKDILFHGMLQHLKKEYMTFDFGGHANEKGNLFIANEVLKKFKLNELNYNKLC